MSYIPRIISFANRKGGSGKTATSVNVAACLADEGKKVLLVDLDSQSHSTLWLGISPYSIKSSVYDLLIFPDKDPNSIISPTMMSNLFVIPANHDLSGAEIELANVNGREYILKKQLDKICHQFEYIIIDSPPSLNILTINALTAAFEVIIPLQAHFLAMEGLGQLVPAVYRIISNLNPELRISGIVATMCDVRTKIYRRIIEEVKNNFGEKLFKSHIRMDIKMAEAPSYQLPIILYASDSNAATDYRFLAKEIINQEIKD